MSWFAMKERVRKTLRLLTGWMLTLALCLPAQAQYPGHPAKAPDKPEPKLRAVAVLEWTGEAGKPSASRIIPIAVYDGERYQDGGLYLAQPAPLAVSGGTEYELQKAGAPQGLFDVFSAQNMQGFWYGFGVWKPLVVPKPHKLAKSKVPPTVVKDNDPNRPTLKSRTDDAKSDSTKDASTKDEGSNDPNRPTLHRRDTTDDSSKSSGTADSSGDKSDASEDPDRPTLHKHGDSGSSGTGDDSKRTTNDPDRPTLHKKSADPSAAAGAPVTAANTADDPNRPKLRRGIPEEVEAGKLEPTKLLPTDKGSAGTPDLQQMAAVSDTARRDEHPFTYSWASPEDQAKAQTVLESLAQKALAQGAWTPLTQPVPGTKPAASAKTAPRSAAARRAAAAKKTAQPMLPQLTDEKLSSFELSYNGGATLVFSAKTGDGPAEKYVTLIAQPDLYGVPHMILQSVTDADHLDVKPRMRFVDAVDTDGDNRGELIFELRTKTDRQFAIYRVSGGRALQTFTTTPIP